MERLKIQQVKKALQEWLGKNGSVELEQESSEDRITGWIVHPQFAGVSRAVRQSWLWDGFEQSGELSSWPGLRGTFREQSTQIGLVLTFSPAEYDSAFGEEKKSA